MNLQGYVLSNILQVVAIMYKRVWFINEKENAKLMIEQIAQMFDSKQTNLIIVALTFIKEIINEFTVHAGLSIFFFLIVKIKCMPKKNTNIK